MGMRKSLNILSFLFLSSNLILAAYEVDFSIEDAPVNAKRKIALKQVNLSSAQVMDERGTAKVGDEIEPLETFKIKVVDAHSFVQVSPEDLCGLLNQTEEEKEQNTLWQSIVFTVKEEGKPDEDVVLYWAPSRSSLFVNGGSQHFVLSAFQRDLPKKKKNGSVQYKIKINFFEKR